MKELSNNNDNNHQILQQRPSPAGTEDCNRSRDEGKNSIERNSEEEDLVITTNGAENGSCAAEPFAKVEGSDSQGRGADEADQPDSKRVCVRPIDIVEARTYGTVEEGPVRISNVNLQGNVCLSDEETCVTSFSGYRSVRATHGVRQGTWVYEVKIIEPLTDGLGVRVGWVTKDAPLDEPVGANRNGYGFVAGTAHAVHDRQKRAYGSLAALKGDVIGCLLHIPLQKKSLEPVAEDIVRYKGHPYIMVDREQEKMAQRQILRGSFIEFYVNGIPQGKHFEDIFEGTYYPCISLFTNTKDDSKVAKVHVNFGKMKESSPWWCEYTDHCFSTVVQPCANLALVQTKEESF